MKYTKTFLQSVLKAHGHDVKILTPEWFMFALNLIQTDTLEKIKDKLK